MKEWFQLIKELYNNIRSKELKVKLDRWDVSFYGLIVFFIIYAIIITINYQKVFSWHLKEPNINLPNIPSINQYITNEPLEEFKAGEVVGIRYFNIYGLVVEKTKGIGKTTYEILYKDGSKDLQKISVEGWLLYHPPKESLSPLILQN